MSKTRILVLVVCLAAIFLGGCVIARDITGYMPKEEREKFADQVATKVVEKLKAEKYCPKTAAAAEMPVEPNNPCK
jgi:hypothetical protein